MSATPEHGGLSEAERASLRGLGQGQYVAAVERILAARAAAHRGDSMAESEGCDCTELCSMGTTCPGGILAGLDGAGCWRTTDPRTHGLNHAPLPEGTRLAPGFCAGCDEEAVRAAAPDALREGIEELIERCRGNYADAGDGGEPLRNYVLIEELRALLDDPAAAGRAT